MNRIGRLPRLNRTLGVVLATLGWMIFAPADAHASCGDYVMIGDHADHAASAMPDHPSTPAMPCPCQGPSCSSQDRLPAPVPPPVSPTKSQDSIALTMIEHDDQPDRGRFQVQSLSLDLTRHSLRVEHPPR